MLNRYFLFIFLFLLFLYNLNAQIQPSPDEDVIKVSTDLVQVDFLVLDEKGNSVKNLSAVDLEIFQDGKVQEIVNFSYIDSQNKIVTPIVKNKKDKDVKTPPIPASSLQNGRLITFVVDDGNCNSSIQGINLSKEALKKFINEQMLPNDRVAIYQTKGGSSLFRQYTSNKEQLLRIIGKLNVAFQGPGCGRGIFDSVNTDSLNFNDSNQNRINERLRDGQAEGSIGVLKYVTDRLKNVPGRKSVFFLSEGLAISREYNAVEALNVLSNSALRSSVAFYTIDTRGLADTNVIRAEDLVNGNLADDVRKQRRELVVNTREGLEKLAESTGGDFIRNKNFFDKEISQIIQRENGYYLLGYQPEDETFKGKNFHKIEIKLKNPNLRLFSRNGFYGVANQTNSPKQKTADSPLYQALASPLQETGIEIKMSPMIVNNVTKGNLIRPLLHLRGKDLTFADQPDGNKKLSLDVVFVILDEKGKLVSEQNRNHKIIISAQDSKIVEENGLAYSIDIPVKAKGIYSVQAAVRDNNSNLLGSAGDFVEITEFKRDKFFVAGFITGGLLPNGGFSFPTAKETNDNLSLLASVGDSSIRKYRSTDTVGYTYTIYNAKNPTNLTAQIRIYKQGTMLVESKESPLSVNDQTDLSRIKINNFLRMNSSVLPDNYVLQIIIRDKDEKKTVSQWIDFEVIN